MSESTPNKRGGAGRGQGRKPTDGVPNKSPRNVLMSQELFEYAKQLGAGKVSAGVTRALLHARDCGLK